MRDRQILGASRQILHFCLYSQCGLQLLEYFIHRKRLVPDGVTYRGDRIDKNSEFVRAKDIWFRPVQMALGADGSLLICDMYRETIEHPLSLPKVLKRQLDLSSGNRGRIYRVVIDEIQTFVPTGQQRGRRIRLQTVSGTPAGSLQCACGIPDHTGFDAGLARYRTQSLLLP